MNRGLCQTSIYTIAAEEKLARAVGQARPTKFSETKPWVTGYRLWELARKSGEKMPVLFADAGVDTSRLIYWGFLAKVVLEGNTTHYFVSNLKKLKAGHSPQELVLRSTGKTIAPNFIRPYAICRTPRFLTGSTS